MTPNLTYGTPPAAYPISPTLSYGSIGSYGMPTNRYSGPLPAAPATTALPTPGPMPLSYGAATVQAPGTVSMKTPDIGLPDMTGLPLGSRADLRALQGTDVLGNALADAAGPMGFGDALKGLVFNSDGGFNLQGLGSLAKGIGAFGGLWSAFQQNKLARDAFDFQKKAYQTNLTNSIQSYNTALEGRTQARFAQENRSAADADRYIETHRLRA